VINEVIFQTTSERFVEIYNKSGSSISLNGYYLSTDPAETKNVAKQNPEVVDRLTKLAQKYIDDGRSTPGKSQENNGATYLYPSWIRKANPEK
jgi:hypothetical protein